MNCGFSISMPPAFASAKCFRSTRACWGDDRRASSSSTHPCPLMDRNLRELPAKGEAVAAKAARTLAQLQDLAEEARVTLNHLRRDIAAAEERLRQGPAEPLVEVNEQLVLAMLHARNEAEEASATLQEVARSAETDALT